MIKYYKALSHVYQIRSFSSTEFGNLSLEIETKKYPHPKESKCFHLRKQVSNNLVFLKQISKQNQTMFPRDLLPATGSKPRGRVLYLVLLTDSG